MMDRYDVQDKLGDGTFGTVYLARHKQHGHKVAIKYMKKEFLTWEEAVDLREARILMSLSKHANIVQIREIIREKDEQLFFVFEYMSGGNLYEFMRKCTPSANKTGPTIDLLTPDRIQSITMQVLKGLAHLHRHGYVHRDIKPENLLLDGETVKLADFGLARECSSPDKFTEYISTRWYRAPEVILRASRYGKPIDLFGLGCIMAELFSKSPLVPGKNEHDQLERMTQLLGTPSKLTWPEGLRLAAKIGYKFPTNSASHSVLDELRRRVPQASSRALQLIKDLVEWNPRQRPTAEEALKHEYFLPETPHRATLSPTSVLSHSSCPAANGSKPLLSPQSIAALSTQVELMEAALSVADDNTDNVVVNAIKRRRLERTELVGTQALLDRPGWWMEKIFPDQATPMGSASTLLANPYLATVPCNFAPNVPSNTSPTQQHGSKRSLDLVCSPSVWSEHLLGEQSDFVLRKPPPALAPKDLFLSLPN